MTNEICTKYTFRTLLAIIAFLLILLGSQSTFAGQTLARNLTADLIEGQNSAKNYIRNSSAEQSTKGWATYADAAGATPVNGTGGAPTVTLTRSTASPLVGLASFVITKDAANRQGEGASYDFTMDSAYTGANPQNMAIDFFYSTGGTFVNGTSSDVQVYIYDVDVGALVIPQSTSINNNSGRFQSSFLAVNGSTHYRLIFHVATTSAAAWTLKVDQVSINQLPTTFTTSGASSVVVLETGNGFGSTNTNVRRYTNASTQGTAITCADSATLGHSCTINQPGVYTANRIDRNTGAASNFGIVKNDDCTTGGFDSVASGDQVAYTMAASNVAVNASSSGVALQTGDIIRACDDSAAKTNDVTARTSRLSLAKVRDESLPSSYIVATGGAITTDGNYKVHTFTSSGTFQITGGFGVLDTLVVAGGGGSGTNVGGVGSGGGGAGGYIFNNSISYGVGSYTVTVGAGGAADTNGSSSAFDTLTASGGGTGANSSTAAAVGGSGGGGGSAAGFITGAAGTGAQGFAGGSSNLVGFNASGGGGGAGGVGGDKVGTNVAGAGGVGVSNSITGAAVFYASGGGGGSDNASTPGGASAGGGGAGASTNGVSGANGTANTGGGAGGGGTGSAGSSGGSGIVIVRYQYQ